MRVISSGNRVPTPYVGGRIRRKRTGGTLQLNADDVRLAADYGTKIFKTGQALHGLYQSAKTTINKYRQGAKYNDCMKQCKKVGFGVCAAQGIRQTPNSNKIGLMDNMNDIAHSKQMVSNPAYPDGSESRSKSKLKSFAGKRPKLDIQSYGGKLMRGPIA